MVGWAYYVMNDGCILILLRIDGARDVEGEKLLVSMIGRCRTKAKCIIYVYM